MGMTITEKILARHAGVDRVTPGEIINARVDIALANDITAPIAIQRFHDVGARKVFDRQRVVLVPDHFVPNKDIQSAMQVQTRTEVRPRAGAGIFFRCRRSGHRTRPAAGTGHRRAR